MTEFLIRHFVKDYEHTEEVSVRTPVPLLAPGRGSLVTRGMELLFFMMPRRAEASLRKPRRRA